MHRKIILGVAATVVLAAYVLTAAYHATKPLPEEIGMHGQARKVPAESVTFLADRTYINDTGQRRTDQEIFDEVLAMIEDAREYILLDMFLYNPWQGPTPETTRLLTAELTDALVAAKREHPDMHITVITDPINTAYGADLPGHFQKLDDAGVSVVMTDLAELRDSNPLYSGLWRIALRWLDYGPQPKFMPHPFDADGKDVSLQSWLTLINFKANHRKVIVADQPAEDGKRSLATLVTSANPHDASSAHGNIAIRADDALWRDVIASERATAKLSGARVPAPSISPQARGGDTTIQLLTEQAIQTATIHYIKQAGAGDTIDMAMFYLSDRDVIDALVRASGRGADVRLILDPNKDAFGHKKNGVPNRPVAHELRERTDRGVNIRWCDTHGEQCHAKLVLFSIDGTYTLIGGSANLTRRNIENYNLETNVRITSDALIPAIEQARAYFNDRWHNAGSRTYTTDYNAYADDSFTKTLMYRVQEWTGLSSF